MIIDLPRYLRDIMSSPVICVDEDAPISYALRVMNKHDIGSVVVMRNDSPVGILTERDILRGLVLYRDLFNMPVKKMMSNPLITCAPDTPILKAFTLMYENRIRRLPVLENGRLVGIVTERDVIYWMLRIVGYDARKS